jgi:hypothetical protein
LLLATITSISTLFLWPEYFSNKNSNILQEHNFGSKKIISKELIGTKAEAIGKMNWNLKTQRCSTHPGGKIAAFACQNSIFINTLK